MNETFRASKRTLMNPIRRRKLTETLLRRYEKYLSEKDNNVIEFLVDAEKFIL